MMERGNGPTESKVVEVAKPGSDETVLVIGPGPGVGLDLAAARARQAIGVDPSEEMLRRCRRRCAAAVEAGTVELRTGTAEATGQETDSVDVVLSVNNLMLWSDRSAALAELLRVLRPGGRLLLSAHEKWLPVPRHELVHEFETIGFTDVQSWTWDPPGRAASRAVQLRAVRPRS
ncbi:Methyltransferase domain-containing protein [Amycolatopsis marina]|uniref:Methyltransferase domain-containing protein n=2 Tax=Amycolatopsis marina TaxID=490629 RepID=A0A1I0ZQW5_9PSEU|nr:Methyltransferase domain-containing protein [Amycolatopsis marina]